MDGREKRAKSRRDRRQRGRSDVGRAEWAADTVAQTQAVEELEPEDWLVDSTSVASGWRRARLRDAENSDAKGSRRQYEMTLAHNLPSRKVLCRISRQGVD